MEGHFCVLQPNVNTLTPVGVNDCLALMIVYFTIDSLIIDTDQIEKARHILCTLWSEKWLSRLNSFDANVLSALSCQTYVVAVKHFTSEHYTSYRN